MTTSGSVEGDRVYLALETAGFQGSTALVAGDGTILAEEALGQNTRHGKGLMASAKNCLERAGVGLDGLTGCIVDIGPGSFTGLRVGVMTAKALAWAGSIPVLGIYSLDAMAWGRRAEAECLFVCNTARRDEVYGAFYRTAGDTVVREGVIQALSVQEAFLSMDSLPEGTMVVGSGLSQLREEECRQLSKRVSLLSLEGEAAVPTASAVAQWGALAFCRHPSGHDLYALQPVYPRKQGASMPVLGEPVERPA